MEPPIYQFVQTYLDTKRDAINRVSTSIHNKGLSFPSNRS